ncbi:MAG: sulfatase-like hydrolase/transferase [Gemmatimonadetes bacterium]|nr:sulfatase-like hydrolase/transferase [Gemmatimonadota bacterium]MYG86605.1 sulfatase-like hydrolase/transferase [Gemmatimonadota bacterium]MYJ88581.1 sulfatase-like hydrolase/transferase [Gemmatimonadota bacterium]
MPSRSRPNILWISFEDTGPYYGCYGDPVARTPNVDRIAAEGCRWTHCFSTSGVCAPARSAIITGMYATSIGTHHMRTTHVHADTPEMPTPYSAVPPHYVKCFTEYLRAAGYYCTNNFKTDYQFDPPLTAWDDQGKDAHWRNRPDPEQPFFAVFNLMRSHESGMWPEKCPSPEFDSEAIEPPPHLPDTPKVREALARMYTHIAHNDREFGTILGQLEEDGLAGNTYVFNWSDHGPLPRGKRWPYDAGIHVPLIARGPDLEGGQVCEDLVSTVDLGPTMLSLAGVGIPHHIQGRAFLGEQARPPREYVYASRDRHDVSYDMVRAVRDGRYKYIRNYRPDLPYLSWIPYRNRHPIMQEIWRLHVEGGLDGTQSALFRYPRPVEEFYDTEADPHEVHNLADDPRILGDLERMRGALDAWLEVVGDLGRISESEMVRDWYPDGRQPKTAPVVCVPVCPESPGIEPALEGGSYDGPLLLQLHCATQGASIAYTLQAGDDPHWLLYTEPLRLEVGEYRVRARAIRIGYKESPEIRAKFLVREA